MKFGKLVKYNSRKIFFVKNHAENEARRLVLDFYFFFFKKKKTLYEVKASGLQLSVNAYQ